MIISYFYTGSRSNVFECGEIFNYCVVSVCLAKMHNIFIRITFLMHVCISASRNFPEVQIGQGILKGKSRKTWQGRTFSAFTGIPYAQPPVAELRFKPPLPVKSWEGIFDASKPHAVCPQMDIFVGNYTPTGNEDCLFLNVYTPQLVDTSNKMLLPVMFYIHGGGFFAGSGNADLYGPDILLDKDIVLVTLNYRLGALGFLSTEDEVLPGNNGMKDQNLALNWVKANIVHFGGNPEKITVFGQSAGGASAHYHMLSPLSKDLISGAITQSGTALATWAFGKKGQAVRNAKNLAEYLNCPTTSSQEIVACLSKIDAYDIVKQAKKFLVYSYDPLGLFKPVVEPNIKGAFLTEHPIDIIKSGKAANIPMVTGITSEDGAIRSAGLYNDSKLIEELNRDFDRLAPIIFDYDDTTTSKDEISKSIREFYFGDKDIDYSTKPELTNMFTDSFLFYPQHIAAQLHAKHSKQPVYSYIFGYRGSLSYVSLAGDTTHDYGVCHGDELLYLLSNDFFPKFESNSPDIKFIDIMTTLWTNFATTGNPTPQINSLIHTKWEPVSKTKLTYYLMKGENDIKMVENVYSERVDFWKNLPIDNRKRSIKDEL